MEVQALLRSCSSSTLPQNKLIQRYAFAALKYGVQLDLRKQVYAEKKNTHTWAMHVDARKARVDIDGMIRSVDHYGVSVTRTNPEQIWRSIHVRLDERVHRVSRERYEADLDTIRLGGLL